VTDPLLPVAWRAREEPLVPVAVAARGLAASALASRMLARDDETLGRWLGVAAPSLLLVLGEGAELPWADGVLYLGRDPEAPALLLPTTLQADVPAALLQQALLRRGAGLAPPLAVLLDPAELVPAGPARPVLRAELARWLGGAK
jgi:MoxR-vWA-beta-propeller ternary system protein